MHLPLFKKEAQDYSADEKTPSFRRSTRGGERETSSVFPTVENYVQLIGRLFMFCWSTFSVCTELS